jgi:hypothetical protein
MDPPPDPPVDRPTKIRWGCVVALVLVGLVGFFIFLPTMGSVRKDTAAMIRAMHVHRALVSYAADHEGLFPEGITTSNRAFRQLFRDHLNDENYFHVPGSAWHDSALGNKPDNIIGFHPPYQQALVKGENHWAYVSGLRDTSDSQLPLIADGFVEGAPGTYTDDPAKKGGVWKGKKAIVVLVSGAARMYPLSRKSGFRVLQPDPTTGEPVDLFKLPPSPPGTAEPRILNPE